MAKTEKGHENGVIVSLTFTGHEKEGIDVILCIFQTNFHYTDRHQADSRS